jgi:hypothetical protein
MAQFPEPQLPSLSLAAAGGDWSTTEETTHVDPDDLFRRLAGRDDLETVTFLEFTVDTAEHSIGDLGVRVPALEQLKLSGSNVATVRDLGLLRNVQVLWLARSGVHDLEGISALPVLRELYAAFNNVSDLSPLMGAEHLQVLDLEGNAIDDPAEVQYLAFCEELQSLTLLDNAVADAADFRAQVAAALPRLELLDDEPLPRRSGGADERGGAAGAAAAAAAEASAAAAALSAPPPPAAGAAALPQCAPTGRPSTAPAKGDAAGASGAAGEADADARARRRELALIRDGIKYADALRAFDVQSFEALSVASVASGARTRPATASTFSLSGSRPSSSWPPSSLASARGPRGGASGGGSRRSTPPASAAAASSARGGGSRRSTPDDGASDLTFGHEGTMAGNVVHALRRRKGSAPASRASTPAEAAAEMSALTAEIEALEASAAAAGGAESEQSEQEAMLRELWQFKLEHAMRGGEAIPDAIPDAAPDLAAAADAAADAADDDACAPGGGGGGGAEVLLIDHGDGGGGPPAAHADDAARRRPESPRPATLSPPRPATKAPTAADDSGAPPRSSASKLRVTQTVSSRREREMNRAKARR